MHSSLAVLKLIGEISQPDSLYSLIDETCEWRIDIVK